MGGNVLFIDTKDYITTMMKLRSLQFFREIITNHVQSGAELHIFLLISDSISDKIINGINLSYTLATLLSTILFWFDDALVILTDKIAMDIVSLLFQEVPVPDHLGQEIIHSKNSGLSLCLVVQFLFTGLDIGPSCYHGHETTSMDPHILVHRKLCINVPLYVSRLVYWQDQWRQWQ